MYLFSILPNPGPDCEILMPYLELEKEKKKLVGVGGLPQVVNGSGGDSCSPPSCGMAGSGWVAARLPQ